MTPEEFQYRLDDRIWDRFRNRLPDRLSARVCRGASDWSYNKMCSRLHRPLRVRLRGLPE